MSKPIRDQVIVITGASSGIGLATAIAAAASGARVALAARNAADLARAAADIRRDGGRALAVPTDVTAYDQVQALAQRTVEEFGRIDTWVNGAAVSAYAPFTDLSIEDARRIMDVNFIGQLHGAKAALPWLERSGGTLVCIGSTLSDRGVPLQSIYCASKHAVKGWVDALRTELQHAGSSVRVTLIKPSSIDTPLFNKAKTQLGVMPQPIPPVYDPELAAEVILRVARRPERDAFVGGAGKLLSVAERLSPKLVDVHQRFTGFDAQRTDWPKSAGAPHNLHAPVEHDGGVRGDFGRGASHRSAYQEIEARSALVALAAGGALALGAKAIDDGRGGAAPSLMRAGALALIGKGVLGLVYLR